MSESVNPSSIETNKNIAPHPVAHAIDKYLESTRDISLAGRMFIPEASKTTKENAKQLVADFDQAEALLAGNSAINRAQGLKLSFATIRKVKRLRHSRLAPQLENSLFINLFSSFDVFTGELIAALHKQKPDLFHRLNRDIPLASVLAARSIEVLKQSVLDDKIESIRRKSYSDQFEYLEKTFGIQLRKFDKWAYFVEATQRRNLLTHCGGVVSEQYRNNCISADYPADLLPGIGNQIGLGDEYFFATCELMHEIGLKLGQTLWRKVLPDEVAKADDHLVEVIYDALTQEHWTQAVVVGEFLINQRCLSSELTKQIAIVNYSIALKQLGRIEQMKKVLSKCDFSASIPEFRLAEAVLFERTEEACRIMKVIGKEGQLLQEHSYHSWPLFSALREETKFQDSYEDIYGYPFVSKVQQDTRDEREKNIDGDDLI